MSRSKQTGARGRIAALCVPLVGCILSMWIAIAPAQADLLQDTDSKDFQDALALWLEGDDAAAIPRLAELAQVQGNLAAKGLLGMIDKIASLQGPDLVAHDRAERLALLRAPGGLSGRNWMSQIADESELAQLWVALWQVQGGVEIARRFVELGEARATRETLLVLVSRYETGFDAEVLAQSWYPESLVHLTTTRVLDPDDIAGRPAGDPIRRFAGQTVLQADLQDWLGESDHARPLRAACAQQCMETKADCTLALYRALDGYSTLLLLGSPIAALIPDQEFAQSQRAIDAVARRIMLKHSARTRHSLMRQIDQIDACAASWLRAEFERYYPKSRERPASAD